MEKKTSFTPGNLIVFVNHDGLTLCRSKKGDWSFGLKECPCDQRSIDGLSDIYDSLDGKVGLLSEVILNKLDQPVGYRILMDGNTYFCKSIMADKYLRIKN